MLAVCGPSPDPAWAWPPEIEFEDSEEIRANAGLIERDNKLVPVDARRSGETFYQ